MAAEQDGRKVYIQTDHRSPAEMNETSEISVLFALVRTLLPHRMTESGQAPSTVRYAALDGASDAVAEAIASTGAELESSGSGTPEVLPYAGTPRTPAEIADEAFKSLAHTVALRESVPISGTGLADFEARLLAQQESDPDLGEIESWTAALELAALTGECLRRNGDGGQWQISDEVFRDSEQVSPSDLGILPFIFTAKGGFMHNAANKAIRAMSEPGQSTVQLLASAKPADGDDGTTVVVLKPSNWGTDGVYARPLLENVPDVPLVVIGQDHPNNVAYPTTSQSEPEKHNSLMAEALVNLAQVEVEIEKLDLGIEMDLYVVHGDFYAAEKILDEAFMHRMHALIGQELLAVAIPVKSRMFVTAGAQAPDNLARIIALAQGVFEREPHPITPKVFGVMNGKVSAIVQASGGPSPEPKKKKGFWARLFG